MTGYNVLAQNANAI